MAMELCINGKFTTDPSAWIMAPSVTSIATTTTASRIQGIDVHIPTMTRKWEYLREMLWRNGQRPNAAGII